MHMLVTNTHVSYLFILTFQMTSSAPCAIDDFLTALQDKDNNKTWWNLGTLGVVMDAVKLTTPTLQFFAHSMKARKREKTKEDKKTHH